MKPLLAKFLICIALLILHPAQAQLFDDPRPLHAEPTRDNPFGDDFAQEDGEALELEYQRQRAAVEAAKASGALHLDLPDIASEYYEEAAEDADNTDIYLGNFQEEYLANSEIVESISNEVGSIDPHSLSLLSNELNSPLLPSSLISGSPAETEKHTFIQDPSHPTIPEPSTSIQQDAGMKPEDKPASIADEQQIDKSRPFSAAFTKDSIISKEKGISEQNTEYYTQSDENGDAVSAFSIFDHDVRLNTNDSEFEPVIMPQQGEQLSSPPSLDSLPLPDILAEPIETATTTATTPSNLNNEFKDDFEEGIYFSAKNADEDQFHAYPSPNYNQTFADKNPAELVSETETEVDFFGLNEGGSTQGQDIGDLERFLTLGDKFDVDNMAVEDQGRASDEYINDLSDKSDEMTAIEAQDHETLIPDRNGNENEILGEILNNGEENDMVEINTNEIADGGHEEEEMDFESLDEAIEDFDAIFSTMDFESLPIPKIFSEANIKKGKKAKKATVKTAVVDTINDSQEVDINGDLHKNVESQSKFELSAAKTFKNQNTNKKLSPINDNLENALSGDCNERLVTISLLLTDLDEAKSEIELLTKEFNVFKDLSKSEIDLLTKTSASRDAEFSKILESLKVQCDFNTSAVKDACEKESAKLKSDIAKLGSGLEGSCSFLLDPFKERMVECNSNVDALEAENTELKQEIGHLRDTITQIQTDLAASKKAASVFERKAKLAKNEESLQKIAHESFVLAADLERQELSEQVAKLKREIAELKADGVVPSTKPSIPASASGQEPFSLISKTEFKSTVKSIPDRPKINSVTTATEAEANDSFTVSSAPKLLPSSVGEIDSIPRTFTPVGKCRKKRLSMQSAASGVTFSEVQEGTLASAIAKQPVLAGLVGDHPVFQFYKSGVLSAPPMSLKSLPGINSNANSNTHGVLAVGYGSTTEGLRYYKIKNSFGPSWGEAGYCRLAQVIDNKDAREKGAKVLAEDISATFGHLQDASYPNVIIKGL